MIAITIFLSFITVMFFLKNIGYAPEESRILFYHTLFTMISIALSFSISFLGWNVFSLEKTSERFLLFISFLYLSIFDILNIVATNGMPGFFSGSLSEWFWILSRLPVSISLLFLFAIDPWKVNPFYRYSILAACLLPIFFASIPLFAFPDRLLANSIVTKGLETILVGILSITLFFLFRKYPMEQKPVGFFWILAYLFLILSEVLNLPDQGKYGWLHATAHGIEIMGFVYFRKGFYIKYIKNPLNDALATQRELMKVNNQLTAINDAIGEGLFVLDKQRKVTFINSNALSMLGYQKEELTGKEIHPLIHQHRRPDGTLLNADSCPIHRSISENRMIRIEEDLFQTRGGKLFPVSYVANPLSENGVATGCVVVFQNITKQKQYIEKIRQQAYFDSLTGLPNRFSFLEKLEQTIKEIDQNDSFAVLRLDLDNFKNINDTYGHIFGDRLLRNIGKRISSIDPELFVSHHSGDEFSILFRGDTNQIEKMAQRICKIVNSPFTIDQIEIFTSVSIGISLFPQDGWDSTRLLQVADHALSEAKKRGKNRFVFYDDELERQWLRKAWIEQHLYTAMIRQEISVHYQPIVDIKTHSIIGMEALARWRHPRAGFIPPTEFIQVAENNGLIIPIGNFILEVALNDLKKIHDRGFRDLFISINLSLRQLKYPEFLPVVKKNLEKTGIDPKRIQFEITESVTLLEDPELVRIIHQLRACGFRIAIDDFGKGYSSIGYLRQIAVDTIKIDKSYVYEAASDETAARLTRAIITMAKLLKLDIVAEGVENGEHLRFLNQQEHVFAQGFLFSPPLPFEKFSNILDKNRPST